MNMMSSSTERVGLFRGILLHCIVTGSRGAWRFGICLRTSTISV